MDKIKCFDQGIPSVFGEIGVASPGRPGNTLWTSALLNSTGLWSPMTFQNMSGPSLFIVFKLYLVWKLYLGYLKSVYKWWTYQSLLHLQHFYFFFISYLHLLYLYPVRSVLQEQLNSPSKFFNKHFNICIVPILVNLACLGVRSLSLKWQKLSHLLIPLVS